MIALNQHNFSKELQQLKEGVSVPARTVAVPWVRKLVTFFFLIRSVRQQRSLTRVLTEAARALPDGANEVGEGFHQAVLEALGIMKGLEDNPAFAHSKKLMTQLKHNISLCYELERIVRKRLYRGKPARKPSQQTQAVLSMAKQTFARQNESKRRLRG